MLAGSAVQVYAAFDANAFAVRFAHQVDRQIKQQVIPKRFPQVNVTIFRYNFLIQLFLDAAAEDVKLLKLSRKFRPERVKAAVALAVNFGVKFPLQKQPFPRSRKAVFSDKVVKLKVWLDENIGVFHRKFPGKPNGFVKEVSNIGA